MIEIQPIPSGSQIQDLAGQIIGRLTILGFAGFREFPKGRLTLWWYQCHCGNVKKATSGNLKRMLSCGCLKKLPKFEDLIGRRFGKIIILEFAGFRDFPTSPDHAPLWKYRCDCGVEKIGQASNLKKAKSCGCGRVNHLSPKGVSRVRRTHGESTSGSNCTLEYCAWAAMIGRCYNPNNAGYKNYGARNICVCERWRHSYENFLSDMGRKPTPKHTLDRINNDGPYSPENCRWITRYGQSRNTRRNRWLTHQGVTLCMADWAKRLGMPVKTLHNRLTRSGWSVKDALEIPVRGR